RVDAAHAGTVPIPARPPARRRRGPGTSPTPAVPSTGRRRPRSRGRSRYGTPEVGIERGHHLEGDVAVLFRGELVALGAEHPQRLGDLAAGGGVWCRRA